MPRWRKSVWDDINLRKLQETHPDPLPQPDRASRFGSDKTLKKAYLITLLLAVLRDREMARQFFETLPTMPREAIAAVTWEPRANLATLEKTLGCQIADANPDERRIFYEPFLLPPEHGFLVIQKNAQNQWDYYSGRLKPKKEDYLLVLPDEIRKVFKTLVPPPPGFELLPLDSVPDAAHSRYSCEQKAMADLRLVAEYIAQGHLKYTKSEQVAMPSLKILRQMTGGPEFFDAPADSDLALLRTRLLVGGTAFAGEKERENMRTYHALRETVPSLFGQSTGGLVANATLVEDTWSRAVHVDGHNEFKLIGEPLLKGYAFLLAAFGLVEIAYVSPTHDTYRRPKTDYLTPYDGLRFARLTPLGEYVFRQRKTYEVAGGPPTRARIVLDEVRLLATGQNADPLTELALNQFLEKLAPGRYRMTPKSFLGGCGSRADIEERIRLFRRVVSSAPPAIWELFFERTMARIAPLNLEPEYIVLKVSADEEIRRLFASDPVLREIVLKVEGLRIAVRQSDLKKLAKRLEHFGYLSPIPRVT